MEEVTLSWTLEEGDRNRGHLTFQREKGVHKARTLKPCTVGDGMGPTGCGEQWSRGVPLGCLGVLGCTLVTSLGSCTDAAPG